MKILVTGGAGYIGSHTVHELLKQGYETVILDNFSSGKRELVPGGEVIEGDLRDLAFLESIFRAHEFQGVIHFAALTQVGESYTDPQKYYGHNVTTSLNLLHAILKANVKLFIFSSSAAVYGIPSRIPIPESHPLSPMNPYGWTKFFVEKILLDYERAYGLKFVSLRYFNAAGADPEGRFGEMHEPETHLIPNILLFLLGKKEDFNIFGNNYSTPDGTAIRDYIHVTDLAKAHVSALQKLPAFKKSEFINLGTNKGYSVMEVVRKVEHVTGQKVSFHMKPKRKGDVDVLLASNRKAKKLIEWELIYSDLDTIIETAWNWHSKTAQHA